MYGQGNYAPDFGKGSHTPMPPFQQRPVAPPPPPPQQLGLPQPSTIQQGPPSIPHPVSYSGSFAYQHAPTPPIQQRPPIQVPSSGMLNSGQSYLLPPPPRPPPQQVRGSTSAPHPYTTAQQTSQWTQNTLNIPTPVPPPLCPSHPIPSHPEMFRPSIPPRVLPTLPSQGQTPYRGPIHLQQPGSMQGSHQFPRLPPPPPTSSFFTPTPFGSFTSSAHRDSNGPNMGPMPPPPPPPPPPPSSPPPLPPSPPPPTSPFPSFGTLSSTPRVTASDLSHNSGAGPISNLAGSEVMASGSVGEVVVTAQIRDDALAYCDNNCDNRNPEGNTSYEAGSLVEEHLYNVEGTKLDLPPPPPKPLEEKVVRKIVAVCHDIAKNGPSFEEITRQKESGNPEFEFLFGGELGSEAAVAHEYFEWMKNECILAHKLQNEQRNSASRPSDMDTSTQIHSLMEAGVSHSPADSDMDMEDDITQPDEGQQVYDSFEGLNSEAVLIPKEFREKLHTQQNAIEQSLAKDAISGSSGLADRGKGSKHFASHDHFSYGRSLPKIDSSVTNPAGADVCPSNSDVKKLLIPPLEDSGQSNVSAAAVGSSEKFPGDLIKGASPFRLLQDYASDDSLEENVSPVAASPSTTAGGTSLHGDLGSNLQSDPGSKSLSSSDMAFGVFSESVLPCSVSMPSNALEFFPESQKTCLEANITSTAAVKIEETTENIKENQEHIENAIFPEAAEPQDAFDGIHDAAPESGESLRQKEDVKHSSALPKVDEFGRLVRGDASDSDSDERYTGRRGKRGRSGSRSRSPHDRRRRRSPQRRKEKRSRSRSWSPKKRRSRSKSPSYRRGGESSGDKMRRDRGQLPECFDFLRGRCHRGAFCRYMHHDSDKSDGGRSYRSKQKYVEVPLVSGTSDFLEEIEKAPPRRLVRDQDMLASSFDALKDGSMDREKVSVSVKESLQTKIYGQDDKSLDVDVAKSERSREVTAIMHGTRNIKEEMLESTTELSGKENCAGTVESVQPVDGSPSYQLTDAGAPKSPGDTSHGIVSSPENLVISQSQPNPSLPGFQNAYHQPLEVDGSSTFGSSLIQTSTTFQNQLPVSAPHVDKLSAIRSYPGTSSISQPLACDSSSSQTLPSKDLMPPITPALDFPDQHSRLLPSLPSLSQGTSAPPAPQPPGEMMQPTSNFPSFYPPMGNSPPNQSLLQNQHAYFAVLPNSSWSLPPPPPLPGRPLFVDSSTVTSMGAMQGAPWLQFQQNQLPPRNDSSTQMFVRPYPPQLPIQSQPQLGEFEHCSYSVMEQEPPRPSSHMGDFRPNPPSMGNAMSQPFGGTGLVGEHFSRYPVQGLNPSFAQGNISLQPVPSTGVSTSFQDYPHSQQQRALYGLPRTEADGPTVSISDYGNIDSTMSRYSALIDRNQPSNLSDFGGSKISNHFNPYASTFDEPLTSKISKFSSNVFKQEKGRPCLFDASYSLSHLPLDGQGVESLGSRNITSSAKAARAADLPRPGSDQYDPLFDSIEPSSNSSKKFDHGQRHEAALRLSGSRKPLDVEEINKHKEVEAVAISTSIKSENDECGETADAEVGDVDNASESNPLDEGNTAVGEIEIDQIKTPGKSKKSKDSRSMRLFRVAIANFVKEQLKPSWRQGNMSKEAFKTIVKKTVDKVSGAMKNHRLPKSQAKINHYIDSSHRKLAKLVKGYVQKYAEG